MKSLQTVQKMFKVLKTLSFIAMIISFCVAGLSLISVIWLAVLQSDSVSGLESMIMYAFESESLDMAICALLSDTVFALTDGVLSLLAWRYFKAEQECGTPFYDDGVKTIRNVGISVIVMPNVAVIVAAVIYACFGIDPGANDWTTAASSLLGVVLILLSLVFRYGSDLEKKDTENS